MATLETYQPPDTISGLQRLGMAAGFVGVLLTAVGFMMADAQRFYQAYLVAYTFWMGLVLGSMALLMVQHLSGGAWGVVIRRPLEAVVRTMPIMAAAALSRTARLMRLSPEMSTTEYIIITSRVPT